MDPLNLLRQFTRLGRKATLEADGSTLLFGDSRFAAHTTTRYHSKVRKDEYYSLIQLWFLMQNKDEGHSAYMRACREKKIGPVTLVDKKDVISYLTGKVDVSAQVDPLSSSSTMQAEKLPASSSKADASKSGVDKGKVPKDVDSMELDSTSKEKENLSDTAAFRIMSHEQTLHTRFSIVRGTKKFSKLSSEVKDIFSRPHRGNDVTNLNGKKRTSNANNKNKAKRQRGTPNNALGRADGHPIIVVPASMSAMLTLYNAETFLANAKYVESGDLKKKGARKPSSLFISHRFKNGSLIKFRVVDSVRAFKQDEYNRIVCVFAQGQAWQFKGWSFGLKPSRTTRNNKPTEISPSDVFSKAMGMYVCYDNVGIPAIVKQWKIPVLTISKSRRHFDRSAFNDCWLKIEEFLLKRKSDKMTLWANLLAEEETATDDASNATQNN